MKQAPGDRKKRSAFHSDAGNVKAKDQERVGKSSAAANNEVF
jgi:hypothetical protein